MTPARYIEGMVSVAVVGGGLWVATGAIRVRFLPGWSGGPARLARVVVGIGLLTIVSELLGLVGGLHLLALVVTIGGIGLFAWWTVRWRPPNNPMTDGAPSAASAHRREGRWERIGALLSVAMVAGEWGPGVINAFRSGVPGVDSLWYHMPFAARFAQSGSVLPLHNINNDNVIAFYPATSELLHAVAIVLMGSDVLSPLFNLGWLALALVAAWCLGHRFGVGSLAVMGTAVVMGASEFVADEPGSAYNDVVGIALVLSAVALLAWTGDRTNRRPDVGGFLVAALAAGLALGVKYTFIFPVVALTVGAIALVPRGRRMVGGLIWVVVVVIAGSFWYFRNLAEAGNPVPNIHVHLAGIDLPTPASAPAFTVWHVLFFHGVWSTDIFPGLSQAFGPGWWLLSVTACFGLVAGLLAGSGPLWRTLIGSTGSTGGRPMAGGPPPGSGSAPFARLLGFVGIVTVVGYLITPEPNLPVSFVYDLRFAALAVVLGLLVLPLLASSSRWLTAVLIVLSVLVVAAQFAKGIWVGSSQTYHSFGLGLLVAGTVLVVGGLWMWLRRRVPGPGGSARWVALAGVVLTVVIGGFFVERYFLAHWYLSGPEAQMDRWADSVHGARIGVSGLTLAYPLYGASLTNDVTYIGTPEPHGAFGPVLSCPQWRRAINAGHFAYVVSVEPLLPNNPRSSAYWTGTNAPAKSVVKSLVPTATGAAFVDVFKIEGRLDPSGC